MNLCIIRVCLSQLPRQVLMPNYIISQLCLADLRLLSSSSEELPAMASPTRAQQPHGDEPLPPMASSGARMSLLKNSLNESIVLEDWSMATAIERAIAKFVGMPHLNMLWAFCLLF